MDDLVKIDGRLKGITELIKGEQNTFNTIKDNLISLISVISLINERILRLIKDLDKVSDAELAHGEQHNNIIDLLLQNKHDLQMMSAQLKEHRKDSDRFDSQIEKLDNKTHAILEKLNEFISEIRNTFDCCLNNKKKDSKNNDEKPLDRELELKKTRMKIWGIVIAALIGAPGIWKIVEIVARILSGGGQ